MQRNVQKGRVRFWFMNGSFLTESTKWMTTNIFSHYSFWFGHIVRLHCIWLFWQVASSLVISRLSIDSYYWSSACSKLCQRMWRFGGDLFQNWMCRFTICPKCYNLENFYWRYYSHFRLTKLLFCKGKYMFPRQMFSSMNCVKLTK